MKFKKFLYIFVLIIVLLLLFGTVRVMFKTHKIKSTIQKMSNEENSSVWYLLFGNAGIIVYPEVDVIEIGWGNPELIDSSNKMEDYSGSVLDDKEVITDIMNWFEIITVSEINATEKIVLDQCIDMKVFSEHYKSRHSLRIMYKSDTDEYLIQTFGYNEGWWKVIDGKDACEKIFKLCQNNLNK